MKFLLGKKIEMSQIFDESGKVVPVTLVEAGPCWICQIKTSEEKDGYDAIQIGFEKLEKKQKIKKTMGKKPYRFLREFRASPEKLKVGDKIDVSIFQEGEKVRVSGISKGKGFAGVVKRWGFAGQSATHGTKHEERSPGSTGSRFPQRVVKGRKMAGRMGSERKTIKNLKIVKIDKKNNLLAIKGAIPGSRGTLLEVRSMK